MIASRTERRIQVGGVMAGPDAPKELPKTRAKPRPLPVGKRLVALARRLMP